MYYLEVFLVCSSTSFSWHFRGKYGTFYIYQVTLQYAIFQIKCDLIIKYMINGFSARYVLSYQVILAEVIEPYSMRFFIFFGVSWRQQK